MNAQSQTPAGEKYREAQFFCRKLERADDGRRHVRATTNADAFRCYASAFCSAVDDLHRQAGDRPSFAAWTDDDAVRDLQSFFEDRRHDVLDVTTARVVTETGADTQSARPGTDNPTSARYCLADTEAVPAEFVPDDAEAVPVSSLARAYLDHVEAWLTDTGPQDPDETYEADVSSAE